MNKYEKLDQMILDKLNDNPQPFYHIHSGEINDECEKLSPHCYEGFRVLDRRLQALRKKGLIANISCSKGWVKL